MKQCLIAMSALLSSTVGATPATDFWQQLQTLCDQSFAGKLITHPAGEDGFVGKALLMHVRDCSEDEIRIPFHVGEDRSRTWVVRLQDKRLSLKHEHRHEDGELDAVTNYGGTASNAGRADRQYFPADEQTREVIEAAFSNVWTLALTPGDTFTYGLRRLGTPRVFQIDFDLSQPVATPPPAWGAE